MKLSNAQKMWKHTIGMLCILAVNYTLIAQIGGQHVYEFIELPGSARITGMGGLQLAMVDDDIAMAYQNPALYNSKMHQKAQLGHQLYVGGIQHGYVATAFEYKPNIVLSAGLQYIAYGKFEETNETGQNLGTFTGSEFAFTAGGSYQASENITFGVNAKLVGSYLYRYQSYGLLADVGVAYHDTTRRFTAGLVIKNAGAQFVKYAFEQEPVPFDVQAGFTKRLRYVPFRFGVMLHHLHLWNIRFDDPALQQENILLDPNAPPPRQRKYVIDKLFRHINFTGEFYLGKVLNLRIGYNHLKRAELNVASRTWSSGFSGGIGVELKRWSVSYGKAFYSVPASSNHFTFQYLLKS